MLARLGDRGTAHPCRYRTVEHTGRGPDRRADQLSERNRLARELHDSVGHALSVVTIQSGAARRMLRHDPDLAERAPLAVEDSARIALDDLDYVLGLLRDDAAARKPQADLGNLDPLLDATRATGVPIEAQVHGDPASVPLTVSREVYSNRPPRARWRTWTAGCRRAGRGTAR